MPQISLECNKMVADRASKRFVRSNWNTAAKSPMNLGGLTFIITLFL
jgi:hypothetical protein